MKDRKDIDNELYEMYTTIRQIQYKITQLLKKINDLIKALISSFINQRHKTRK